ncbi:MAG: type II secretion system protein [Parcubacteria group bacterium]|nr:type II secretion system protein [Parcubacteria group bacterium]
MKHGLKKPAGFTLMEMIVATSIFAIASVIIADLFLISNRAQRRAEVSQAIQSDARVMMAGITDRIRSGEIDYAALPRPVVNPSGALALIDERGREVVIRESDSTFVNTVCPSLASTPCLEISEDGGATFAPMTSGRLRVVGVKFYILPVESPLTQNGGAFTQNTQPRVTVVLGLQSASANADAQTTTFVQTTVSSRVLLR